MTLTLRSHFTAHIVFFCSKRVCITYALTPQATDEAPLLQQQSVQQNRLAPGAGFQPWVHTLYSARPPSCHPPPIHQSSFLYAACAS